MRPADEPTSAASAVRPLIAIKLAFAGNAISIAALPLSDPSFMNFSPPWKTAVRLAAFLILGSLESWLPAQNEPTIISTVPANFATGVSPSAAVAFTFSEAMDPDATTADFIDSTTFNSLPTVPVWSAGNTVLTCTPMPAFPANRLIVWSVSGQNPNGDPLGGETGGIFTTGGSSSGGTGTNRITTFSLGTIHAFEQTSAAVATPDSQVPYAFAADTILASNRTATAVTLMLPSGAVSNLTQNFVRPEQFFLYTGSTNLASINAIYGNGSYTFSVLSATSPQQVPVNLPPSLAQPAAPHVANFAAAQSVNPAQPFTLMWDAFQNGDYISVAIGTVFRTPDIGTAGALNGTATSVVIPADTLQPNTGYDSTISFYRAISNTNDPSYSTAVYRGTTTRFVLMTAGSGAGELVLTNAAWMGDVFSFDVTSSPGQVLSIESSSSLLPGGWQTLLTVTNSTGSIRITDPQSTTNAHRFYRARNGL